MELRIDLMDDAMESNTNASPELVSYLESIDPCNINSSWKYDGIAGILSYDKFNQEEQTAMIKAYLVENDIPWIVEECNTKFEITEEQSRIINSL
jgi:hypothetical protein